MAKKTEYVTDDDLTQAVSRLLGNEELPQLQELRNNSVIILCCLKVVMDDDGETQPPKGNPIKLKKLSDLERLFVDGNAHYILTMDYHYWKNSNEHQQTARLFDTLMDIEPTPTERGLKLKKRESDVTIRHAITFAYFGAFDDDTLLVRDAIKSNRKRLRDFVADIPTPPAETGAPAETSPEPEAEPEPASPKGNKTAVKK